MKADLSRVSFDLLKPYSSVLMQQGRVQLDADWNEQAFTLLRQLRTAIVDIVGPAAGPKDPGYQISLWPPGLGAPPKPDLLISAGDYYVDGILCALSSARLPVSASDDRTSVIVPYWSPDAVSFAKGQYVQIDIENVSGAAPTKAYALVAAAQYDKLSLTLDPALPAKKDGEILFLRRQFTYLTQPDFGGAPPAPLIQGTALLYLDVWERVVTSLQDPAIREVALGGCDTAARICTVAQVRVLKNVQSCLSPAQIATQLKVPVNRGLLRAQALPPAQQSDPCISAPDAGYRGPENQLYRVEIHKGGAIGVKPSFKWSRENGSVLIGVRSVSSGSGVTSVVLESLGRDDRFSLQTGDYVELESEWTALSGDPRAPLLQVVKIDAATRIVTLAGTVEDQRFIPELRPVLRRWDHAGATVDADNAIPIPSDSSAWIELEDGVQIQFASDGAVYVAQDYWLIPARVATGQLLWPSDSWVDAQGAQRQGPALRPPHGVYHHYAPLAVINVGEGGVTAVKPQCQTPIQLVS
jgi:hypothetical protein